MNARRGDKLAPVFFGGRGTCPPQWELCRHRCTCTLGTWGRAPARLKRTTMQVESVPLETAGLDNLVLNDAAFKSNPFPLYRRLRDEAPVCRVRVHRGDRRTVWLVTRYDDVASLLKDQQAFANDRRNATKLAPSLRLRVLARLFRPLVFHMLASDEPDHARLRSLVQKAFTQRRVEELRGRIETIADELLRAARRRGDFDLVADFAQPLPTTIIAEMLGIPVADRPRFQRAFNSFLLASATQWSGMARNMPRFLSFLRYIRELIGQRRRRPTDDLIGALVAAEEAGDRLNSDELLSLVLLLLVAGYETTVNLIGSGTLALLEHPDQLKRLRAHPNLLPSAIEEFLRYCSPVELAQMRWTRTEVTLGGATIPAGQGVTAALASANRDERQFANPEALDIGRSPNRHLAFGHGIHFCLGAFLARLESGVAFAALLRHFSDIRLAVPRESLRWKPSLLLRGLESLPVSAVGASAAAYGVSRRS
jgi:cytochrome P450